MTVYTIKRNNGDQGFEVSAPDKEWVEAQAEKFAEEFSVGSNKQAVKKSPKPRSTPPKTTATRTNTNGTVSDVVREKLDNAAVGRLVEYVTKRQTAFKLTANQAAIVAQFLKDDLGVGQIDKDDLAFVYKQAGWDLVNHKSQLDNATIRSKYFVRNNGKFELNYAGTKFAQDTALESEG